MAKRAAILVAVFSSGVYGRELDEYNPGSVEVREVHMVLSSHFDAGGGVASAAARRPVDVSSDAQAAHPQHALPRSQHAHQNETSQYIRGGFPE